MKIPAIWNSNNIAQAFFDDFELCPPPGSLELKASTICEGTDVIIGASDIFVDEGVPYRIRVKDVTPGTSNSNIMDYYGCGNPGFINLSDPSSSTLYDDPGVAISCPPDPSQTQFTPYPFSCDDYCSYYEVSILYQLCGQIYTDTVIVHILCGPEVVGMASEDIACPGDDITYCVDITAPGISYQWYDQNGPVTTLSNACTDPIPFDPNNLVYVVATDLSTGCQASNTPEILLGDNCLLCTDNLIADGIFAAVDGTCLANNPTSPFSNSCLTHWENSHGKPTLGSGLTNYFAEMTAKKTLFKNRGKGIMTTMVINQGLNIAGSIDVRTNGVACELILVLDNNVVGTTNAMIPNFMGQEVWKLDLTGLAPGWHTFNLDTKVANTSSSQLIIYPQGITIGAVAEVEVDNICIERQAVVCEMDAELAPDFDLCFTFSTLLAGPFMGGVGPFTYQWSPATHLSNPTSEITGFYPPAKGTYTYPFTVTDANGCSASDDITISVVECKEGARHANELVHTECSLSPNPARERLRLDYSLAQNGIWELYDLKGRKVKSKSLDATQVHAHMNISELAPGIYLSRVSAEGRTLQQQKLVVKQ